MTKLSIVIITYNEEARIQKCLESVGSIADEIVVVDSNSTDRTTEICKNFGCRVILHEFEGYGKQKRFAIEQASNDWVLSLDADEVVSKELSAEIKILLSLLPGAFSGYRIPFAFHYMGRILKNVRADHLRLFDRRKGNFTEVPVHEGVVVEGGTGKLNGKVIHYSYRDISHHLQKINLYTSQAANKNNDEKRKYPKCWVAIKFPVSFFTFYILRLGFLDGYPGFLWSFFAAFYGSLKIAKTIEL